MLSKQSLFSKREDSPAPRNPWTASPASASPPATATPPASAAATPKAPVPAALAPQAPEKEAGSPSRLVVGPNVKLKGAQIDDCDALVVEGRVEATLDSRLIHIAEQGAFSGKVSIDVAEIHGSFDGELAARKQLFIHATGRVSGTIRYGSILIDEGGQVSGDVRALGSEGEKPVGPSASAQRVPREPTAAPEDQA